MDTLKQFKTFDDLVFNPHPHFKDLGIQANLTLDNGYSFSVVANVEGGTFVYGNHPDTYEVAVFNQRGNPVPLSVSGDHLSYQQPHEISALMRQFEMDGILHEHLLVAIRQNYNERQPL